MRSDASSAPCARNDPFGCALGRLQGHAFASTLCHELNQQLTVVLSNAEAGQLMLQARNLDREGMVALLDDVARGARTMAGIIRRHRDEFGTGFQAADSYADLYPLLEHVRTCLGAQFAYAGDDATSPPVYAAVRGDPCSISALLCAMVRVLRAGRRPDAGDPVQIRLDARAATVDVTMSAAGIGREGFVPAECPVYRTLQWAAMRLGGEVAWEMTASVLRLTLQLPRQVQEPAAG